MLVALTEFKRHHIPWFENVGLFQSQGLNLGDVWIYDFLRMFSYLLLMWLFLET